MTGDLAGDVDVVLHDDGHAEQRPRLTRPQPLKRSIGLGQRSLGPNRNEGVELGIETLDASEIELNKLARGDIALPQQLRQACHAGKGETLACCDRPLGGTL